MTKKSIKLKNNKYWDSSSIVHNKQNLKEKLLLPYVLYENGNGERGTVILNDNVSNYEYIDIHGGASGVYSTQRIYNANNKKITIRHNYNLGATYVELLSIYEAKNNKITPLPGECGYVSVSNTSVANFEYDQVNYFNIVKIVGYK